MKRKLAIRILNKQDLPENYEREYWEDMVAGPERPITDEQASKIAKGILKLRNDFGFSASVKQNSMITIFLQKALISVGLVFPHSTQSEWDRLTIVATHIQFLMSHPVIFDAIEDWSERPNKQWHRNPNLQN